MKPRVKRITVNLSENIDAVKQQLQETHGVQYTYVQVMDFLINYYRKQQPPKTAWQK